MKNAIKFILWILVVSGLTTGVVWVLDSLGTNTEINFRVVCDSVKGQTVWNGKQWECLK